MMIRFLIATFGFIQFVSVCRLRKRSPAEPDQPPPNQLSDPATCGSTQLPRVIVRGNQLGVVCHGSRSSGAIKGINRSGLQHKLSLGNAGFPSNPQDELHRFRSEWNAVAVRLPIAQDYYMGSASYRDDISNIVSATQNEGQYLILEVHGYSYNLNPPLPDGQTSVLWDQLARRFGKGIPCAVRSVE